ncbi:serine/threonine protein kinase [bacterium]|nr:serine/threonine protein kinase [bacterium]
MDESDTRLEVMLGAFDAVISDQESTPRGFEILHELDRGGMAVVYLARQFQPDREVALKVVLPQFAGNEEVGIRFQREGRAMAALDHAGVLPVYQVGEWDGMPFLAMKLAKGGTLREFLKKGALDTRKAVDWMIEVGEAVHFAHQRGVLHRDLKPGNLLFDERGAIYVGDFGVAKMEFSEDAELTRTDTMVGTPNYLSPEVASGESNGANVLSDLYGLGAIFYECLTGQRPHDEADNLAAQLRDVVEKEVAPVRKIKPEVARDLEVICGKALAKNPRERYESVAKFVEDLERWREGRGILARPASVPEKVLKWSKRHPLPAALAVLLLVTGIFAAGLLVDNYQRRGELLQESLLERVKDERLLLDPGFRGRSFELLERAKEVGDSERIREEAIAILANWDAGAERLDSEEMPVVGVGRLEVIEEGVKVLGKEGEEGDWILPGGALRCDPAWSSDGRYLAMVRGEDRMEVVIYDIIRRKVFSRVSLKTWPDKLVFDGGGEMLKVLFEDQKAMLVSVRGEVLLKGFSQKAKLLEPIGFTVWKGQFFSASETNPDCGHLSPDQALLATASVSGVQIWDVKERRLLKFYMTENQRIDASTDVWWLSDRELLVQVPGALEVLSFDKRGRFVKIRERDRVPGTRVEEILVNGDWIVEVRDEDDEISFELWPEGDVQRAREWGLKTVSDLEDVTWDGGLLQAGDWRLTLPYGQEIQQVFVLKEEDRLIVVTKSYAFCEWDLAALRSELERRGL